MSIITVLSVIAFINTLQNYFFTLSVSDYFTLLSLVLDLSQISFTFLSICMSLSVSNVYALRNP